MQQAEAVPSVVPPASRTWMPNAFSRGEVGVREDDRPKSQLHEAHTYRTKHV